MSIVYLIHADEGIGKRKVQHYLGKTEQTLEERLQRHRTGAGARLLGAMALRGIAFRVVRTWEGGRDKEKALKALKNARKLLCPVCSPAIDFEA